ncbi:acyl-CoA dehydrogenase family protein [Saccharopolyspora sp. NPDC049357]|uniref:acyl-CoA dehydrogenase family protein n=1 Tax=Saccharopolyspora sp. NPDC049357 TaxID=3154507 RepID=UPI003448BC26
MMQWLPQERLGSAICNVAHAKQILTETLDYTKARQAFGQQVGSFQAQQVPAGRARHPDRGRGGVRRQVRDGARAW